MTQTVDALEPELTSLDDLEKTPHAEAFDEHRPRTVRLQLDAGEHVPEHSHPGYDVVLYLTEGELELQLDDERYEVVAGDVARFSGERTISPHAVEDSTAVVVFAPATED